MNAVDEIRADLENKLRDGIAAGNWEFCLQDRSDDDLREQLLYAMHLEKAIQDEMLRRIMTKNETPDRHHGR